MRYTALLWLAITVLLVAGCAQVPQAPEVTKPPITTQPPSSTPGTTPPGITKDLGEIVTKSKCLGYNWKNRGVARIGYIEGMAKSYQRSLCRMNRVMVQANTTAQYDALAHYNIVAGSEKERLKKLYTLLIGLGMRESSGWYGCGRDMSATNVQHDTAETGLFQFSYNLNSASPELGKLYAEYKANPDKCELNTFKKGFTRSVDENYAGVGPGVEFQRFTRFCPAFAAEYTAIGARVRTRHWGPLIRKEAEYRQECEDMLDEVERITVCK